MRIFVKKTIYRPRAAACSGQMPNSPSPTAFFTYENILYVMSHDAKTRRCKHYNAEEKKIKLGGGVLERLT